MKNKFEYMAKVRSNYDGDTIRLDIDLGLDVWLKNVSCRLLNIDTHEIRNKDKAKKALAIKAKERLNELCPEGSTILIQTEKDKSGKYGRWLVEIFIEDSYKAISVSQILTEEGLDKSFKS